MASNWTVRVYLPGTERQVNTWTISDRSESEAAQEALADIERDFPQHDWTLSAAPDEDGDA